MKTDLLRLTTRMPIKISEILIFVRSELIMEEKAASKSSAVNIGFYKLVWIFAACCIIGFAVETAWCYIRHGYVESRQSLVWGPLSVAYGMGGLLLTLVLYHFKDANLGVVFLISYVVGTVAEYICSLGQEIVFHSVAWDYSNRPLNINGRVCLLYSLFWGVLGVFWVKAFMPATDFLVNKIPLNVNHILVWAFTVFFVFDCIVSASAALRMDKRDSGIAPKNKIEQYLDKEFPDERMHEIYANSQDVSK